jgi:hypothetical protein
MALEQLNDHEAGRASASFLKNQFSKLWFVSGLTQLIRRARPVIDCERNSRNPPTFSPVCMHMGITAHRHVRLHNGIIVKDSSPLWSLRIPHDFAENLTEHGANTSYFTPKVSQSHHNTCAPHKGSGPRIVKQQYGCS